MAKRKKSKNHQTGRSSRVHDRAKKARKPGKRKSRSGATYYERRKNRSDKPGTLEGLHVKLKKFPKRPDASASEAVLNKYLKRVKAIEAENNRRQNLAKSIGRVVNG